MAVLNKVGQRNYRRT